MTRKECAQLRGQRLGQRLGEHRLRARAVGAGELLRRNLLVYGLGGLLVPFAGIKLIDLILVTLRLA